MNHSFATYRYNIDKIRRTRRQSNIITTLSNNMVSTYTNNQIAGAYERHLLISVY